MPDSVLLAASPTIDGLFVLSVLARILHTVCAATLLGGTIYLRFVLAPAMEATADDDAHQLTLFAGRRSAWAKCVGAAALLILISGFGYYLLTVIGHDSMPGVYHLLIGAKMLLALVVIATAALVSGTTDAALKARAGATKTLNVCFAATLAIFLLAATAKTFPHIPKTIAVDSSSANDPTAENAQPTNE